MSTLALELPGFEIVGPDGQNGSMRVLPLDKRTASELVVENHYLHRRPPLSHAVGLQHGAEIVGVVTFGVPPSRHLQMGACPTDPSKVLELNRLWVDDAMPRNTESWFLARHDARLKQKTT